MGQNVWKINILILKIQLQPPSTPPPHKQKIGSGTLPICKTFCRMPGFEPDKLLPQPGVLCYTHPCENKCYPHTLPNSLKASSMLPAYLAEFAKSILNVVFVCIASQASNVDLQIYFHIQNSSVIEEICFIF